MLWKKWTKKRRTSTRLMNKKLINLIVKKYLKWDHTNPFISISALLAFIGVSVGVMVLIIAMAIMNGTAKEFEK